VERERGYRQNEPYRRKQRGEAREAEKRYTPLCEVCLCPAAPRCRAAASMRLSRRSPCVSVFGSTAYCYRHNGRSLTVCYDAVTTTLWRCGLGIVVRPRQAGRPRTTAIMVVYRVTGPL